MIDERMKKKKKKNIHWEKIPWPKYPSVEISKGPSVKGSSCPTAQMSAPCLNKLFEYLNPISYPNVAAL